MKVPLNLGLIVGLALIAGHARAADFFVSVKGSDAAAGSAESPFATPARALQAVREARKAGQSGAVTVWLDDGVYLLTTTLECSGATDADVTFRARHDGAAVLDAALHLKAAQFKRSEDARLPAESRGKVWQCDLATLGVQHAMPFPDRFNDGGGLLQLFANDEWQPLSRWPNEHNARMKSVLDRGDDPGAPGKRRGSFVFDGDRPGRWRAAAAAGRLWLAGFWRVAWDWQSVRVQTLDLQAHAISLAAPVGGGIGSKYAGPLGAGTEPWRAINLVEEIDMPGEWAVDFDTRTLFFWPPGDLEKSDITVADFDGPLVRMKDTSRVTLRGIVLKGTLGNAVEITGGSECKVAGCTITGVGRNGVVVKGGKAHRVESCDLHDLGHGGILLAGGDRATLTPAGHVADNNHIHHYALAKKIWAPGIGVGANDAGYACGCTVTHNLIHDAPHAAVLYGGNDNLFEWNEVHDFLIESDDLGGFYTNNNWTSQGNVVRHNFVHHTAHALGVYLDDADSGDTIEGNVFFRMGTGAAIGGGHDNIFRNNVAIECQRGFAVDARGVPRHYEKDAAKLRDLASVKTGEPPWSTRFPSLVNLLANHPELPTRCVVERNVSVGCEKDVEWRGKADEFRFVTRRDNVALSAGELGFSDAAKLDFRIDAKAAVFEKVPGFERITFEKIGIFVNDLRRTLPQHRSGHTTSEWHREPK